MNIYYNYDGRYLCDPVGDPVQEIPEIAFGEQPEWTLHILRSDGTAFDLSGITAFRAAIDADFKAETAVMCRTLPEGITLTADAIRVQLDSATRRFYEVVNGTELKNVWFELCGYNAAGKRIFYIIFRVAARMTLDPEGTDTLPDGADLFADRAYVMSLFRSGYELEFTSDGSTWSSDRSGAVAYRFRNRLAGGEWSDRVELIQGESLLPDQVGPLAERPSSAPENYKFLAADEGKLYIYRSGAWSMGSPIGPAGPAGRSIEQIAKTSSEGLTDHYTITYSDGKTDSFLLTNGAPGQDLTWDAVGPYEGLSSFDDEKAGFVYAASVDDPEAKKNLVYIWKKASDAYGDWLSPLVLTRYSIAGKNAALIEPVEFTAPAGSENILSLPMSQYTAATIAAVCIDTPDGELTLPHGNSSGVMKILRNKSTNTVAITFGAGVPAYETGRIYFAQGVCYEYDLPDAPADGKIYGRQYGTWVEVGAASSDQEEDPEEDSGDEWGNVVDPGDYSEDLEVVG